MKARTLASAAILLGLCAGPGCWLFENPDSGGSLCTGGPVTLALPALVFCDVDRITGTVTGPDMETIEASIDPANPTATLEIPSGEERQMTVRVYTTDDPDTAAYTGQPVEFCVDAGQPVSVTVTVQQANHNPKIDGVTPDGGQVTAGQTVSLTADASDPDGCDAVKGYSWSTDFGTISGSGASASWVPQCPQSAGGSCEATVDLAVTDRRGGRSSKSFAYSVASASVVPVNVVPVNSAPTVSLATEDADLACWGVELTATASDPDGDALTLSWTILSGGGTLSGVSGTADTTATWNSGCTTSAVDAVVQVTATDPGGASASATHRLVNRAPEVTVDAPWNFTGCSTILTATASDPDGDSIFLDWELITGTGNLLSTSGNPVTYDHGTACSPEDITVRLTVTDSRGAVTTVDAVYTPLVVTAPR